MLHFHTNPCMWTFVDGKVLRKVLRKVPCIGMSHLNILRLNTADGDFGTLCVQYKFIDVCTFICIYKVVFFVSKG